MVDQNNLVVTFSVKSYDKEAINLVNNLKLKSQRTGVTFSHMMITLLKEAKANGLIVDKADGDSQAQK